MRRALMLMGLLLAGAQAVTVTAPSSPLTAEARTPLSIPLTLTNPSAQARNGTLTLELPPGWVLLAGDTDYALAPGEAHMELLTLLPPARLMAGDLTLLVSTPEAAASLRIQVPAAPRLKVEVLDAPEASAGPSYTVTWRITNAGNVEQRALLSAQAEGAQTELNVTQLQLAPGESAEVSAHVNISGVAGAQPVHVTLSVQGQGTPAVSRARTDRLLRQAGTEQLYHVFPLSVTLAAKTGDPGQLDFSVKGQGSPVQGDPGVLEVNASRTAFRVAYSRPGLSWSAGHLTPQTHSLLAGSLVGAAGTLRQGPLTLSVFAGERQGQLSLGAELTARGPRGEVGVSLDRTGAELTAGLKGTAGGQLASGTAQASGAAARNMTTGAVAAEAQASYHTHRADLTISYAGASAGWKGAATPVRALSAGLNLRPSTDVTLGLHLGLQGSATVVPRVSASAAVRRHFGQMELNYLYTPTEQAVSGTLSHTWQGMPMRHVAAWKSASTDAGPRLSYQLSATRRTDTLQLIPTVGLSHDLRSGQTVLSGGLRADLKAGPTAAYSAGLASTNLLAGQFSAELNAVYKVSPTATSTISARVSRQDAHWRGDLRAAVNLAVGVPVHRRQDLARLEGQILLPSGAGAAGLLLRAGDLAAETDAEGRFVFEALPAGTVLLSLLGGILPAGTQLEPALPLLLDLKPQETRRLELRGLRTATLSGRVQIHLPDQPSQPGVRDLLAAEVPPLSELGLQLTAPGQPPVTVAPNPDGSFSFLGLRPGAYRLSLAPGAEALLARHEVLGLLDVTLQDGEQRELTVDIHWRLREVRIDEVQDLTPVPQVP